MTADFPNMLYALLLALVLIFAVRYISGIFQARAQGAHERQYRALAEQAVVTQSETRATMAAVQADLARIASSLAAVEKILQQVE
jgi:preprotein translocase subunit YajC